MRLIDAKSLQLVEVVEARHPYAILSHRWETDEVSFQDFQNAGKREKQAGYRKIRLACKQALEDGIGLVWVDTCCIDKTSSAELSEAINSMFSWYKEATVCYAYLSDAEDLGSTFSGSKWFGRGWTLQELLAPARVEFFSRNWTKLGEKSDLAPFLSVITGVDSLILRGETPLHQVSIARRMSWAARRETTRREDIAYCLMGIFDVNMPMLYGEGTKAFIRLQEEILRNSEDQSLFAWTTSRESAKQAPYRGLFASSPAEFANSSDVDFFPRLSACQVPMVPTNRGIPFTAILAGVVKRNPETAIKSCKRLIMGLNCHRHGDENQVLAIELISGGGDQYLRDHPYRLSSSAPGGSTVTVYVPKHAASDKIQLVPNAERQHAFYFSKLPSMIRVTHVCPESSTVTLLEEEKVLLLGQGRHQRVVVQLHLPLEWTDEALLLILWADRVERTQSYKVVFDVRLTPTENVGSNLFLTEEDWKKPSTLFDQKLISFGKEKEIPSLAFSVKPAVVRGFDMFAIHVRIRHAPKKPSRQDETSANFLMAESVVPWSADKGSAQR